MKSEKKLKEYETVWTCDYCGEEFKTKKESDQHELICKKNSKNNEIIFRIKKPNSGTIFGWASLFIFLYFIVYVVANANAQNNGLQTRDLLQPQKWFSSEGEKEITPTLTPTQEITPTPTLKPKVYVDPDPVIDCKFTYIGTIKLKRSICSKSTDCQIGNKWVYYDSVDKCKADQNAYNQQQTNSNTNNTNTTNYPTYAPYPTYKPIPTSSYVAPTPYVVPTSSYDYNQANIERQQRYDQCKQDCVQNTINLLGAGYYGNPDTPLTDSEYAQKKSQAERLTSQCQGSCIYY